MSTRTYEILAAIIGIVSLIVVRLLDYYFPMGMKSSRFTKKRVSKATEKEKKSVVEEEKTQKDNNAIDSK